MTIFRTISIGGNKMLFRSNKKWICSIVISQRSDKFWGWVLSFSPQGQHISCCSVGLARSSAFRWQQFPCCAIAGENWDVPGPHLTARLSSQRRSVTARLSGNNIPNSLSVLLFSVWPSSLMGLPPGRPEEDWVTFPSWGADPQEIILPWDVVGTGRRCCHC